MTATEAPVNLSRNEVESLCLKAARGAGFAWGLAEEAGFAAGWLATRGLDATGPLVALLEGKASRGTGAGRPALSPGSWVSQDGGPLCPIELGTALAGHAGLAVGPFSRETRLAPVEAPLLLLPFLAQAARICGRTLSLDWTGGGLQVAPDGGFALDDPAGDMARGGVAMKVTAFGPETPPVPKPRPENLPPIAGDVLRRLEALALRTTVPPSEVSRAGAGSEGLDDD